MIPTNKTNNEAPRHQRIQNRLNQAFVCQVLTVEDESHQHRRGLETHFKVIIVSTVFTSLSAVERHKKIYALLDDEFKKGLHALSLRLYTPEEWSNHPMIAPTPTCIHSTEKTRPNASD